MENDLAFITGYMDSHFQQQKQNIHTNFYLNSTRLYIIKKCSFL